MPFFALVEFVLFLALLIALARPVGLYLDGVFFTDDSWPRRVFGPLERVAFRLTGIDPDIEMHWTSYATALVLFNVLGTFVLFLLARFQNLLPLNPQHAPGMTADLAFNTAISFVTNTNWQAYAGETAASTLLQAAGLTVQQFLSAATGLAVIAALIRGLTRASAAKLGNFWVDLTRAWLYVLLPVALVVAVALTGFGVVQTYGQPVVARTLQGARQVIATGPVASMEAIKELGTNGGGFFNANSAHPFENPTPFTSFLEALLIFLIPAGLTWTFGRQAGDVRQGWVIFSAMIFLFAAFLATTYVAEYTGNPIHARMGVDVAAAEKGAIAGNMEGKEVRFGTGDTALFGAVTTGASAGAVNGMLDSFTPLGGGAMLLQIQLGELIFGGVGVGLAAMLVYALLSVFIAGLMVGRTPEYLGKKIESYEIRMAILAVLVVAFSALAVSAVAAVTPVALASRANAGPHGFTELLYAAASAAGNNGSAFAGLAANSAFWNYLLGIGMFAGRFLFIVPVLAIAGSLVTKKRAAASAGTFPTNNGLFVGLLMGVVLIVGALTFFPALALGPIVEQFFMHAGKLF